MKRYILYLLVSIMVNTGCQDKDQNSKVSLPTSGELVVGVDESLEQVVEAEIRTFSFYYNNAYINPLYLQEKQVIEKLLANEIQTGIICRDLYDYEIASIEAKYSHSPVSVKLAEDRIVSIVNDSNPVNNISRHELKKILFGEITNWEGIESSFREESPIVVVMTESSSVNRFFTGNDSPGSITGYALASSSEVIDYVKENSFALGILGGSRFYEKGAEYTEIKMLEYRKGESEGDNGEQDLVRDVFAVTHEPFTGLGTGFISFLTSQRGQLILSKSGMIPYKPIEREVRIMKSF